MHYTGKSFKRAVGILAATIGLTVLTLPNGSGRAAGLPASPVHSGLFAARVVQGPDAGEILAGTLYLQAGGENQLSGRLVVHPVGGPAVTPVAAVQGAALAQSGPTRAAAAAPATHFRYMTVLWVVPVRGEVNPATHSLVLSFALGGGRILQTTFTAADTQVSAQTVGPQQGDVASLYIHIHLEGQGWSIDIYIGKI